MKMAISVVLLIVVFASCICAWPIKKDDTPQLKEDIERIANHQLKEFIADYESSDFEKIASHLDELHQVLFDVQENNNKLLPTINRFTNWIKYLSERDLDSFLWGRLINLLVSAIDGNRDNFSYYRFEAAREWIDRRVQHTLGGIKQNFEKMRQLIVSARDDLDSHAQIFVQGIKKIKALSAAGKAGQNADDIRKVVLEFEAMKKDMKLPEKTQAAIDMVLQTKKDLPQKQF